MLYQSLGSRGKYFFQLYGYLGIPMWTDENTVRNCVIRENATRDVYEMCIKLYICIYIML